MDVEKVSEVIRLGGVTRLSIISHLVVGGDNMGDFIVGSPASM